MNKKTIRSLIAVALMLIVVVVLALTMVVNFVTEYLYQRFFVFGKSLDTAK